MTKLLVTDDSEQNLELMALRLKRRGFDLVLARNGQEALDSARRDAPDAILMDMSMPGMSGWDATRELKSKQETREIPIIALTAHAQTFERERAKEVGCDEFLAKPVEFQKLLATLEKVLGTKMPPAPPETSAS
jgi:two-component system, cell cycle response regulator DivK